MEQRPLRLGDIVDDYCPRERRITNHAIVALLGDVIRQTRCTTCESEHVYKEAKVPKRRRKDDAALYDQVLAEVVPGTLVSRTPAEPDVEPVALESEAPAAQRDEEDAHAEPAAGIAAEAAGADSAPEPDGARVADEPWFGHRRLIRASLPKTDTEPAPRPIPEFTMHQRQTRGSQYFRQGGNGAGRNGFDRGRGGHGHGQDSGQPQGQGGRHRRGGRGRHRGGKRSR